MLLISVVRPTLEYGSEVWEGNKAQAAALESVMIGGAKRILGCSSRTCNEAVRGDMGLDSLQGRRDKAKLKWWYKVATMPEHRYSRSAFMLELRRELGDRFEHFQSLDSFEKSSYVLGSEAWEEYSSGLLGLIKDFVLSVWEERKIRLYGEHANVHQSHSQNDSGDLRGVAGGDGELGCLCGKAGTSHLCDGSAHSSGCVVNGSNAMAAV